MNPSEPHTENTAPQAAGTCRCKQAAAAGARKSPLAALRRLFGAKPAASSDAGFDLAPVDAMIARQAGKPRGLIELMQEVSEHYRYLPPQALERISQRLDVPLSRLYSLATFYQDFKLKPQGQHRLVICTGTACHVKGAGTIVDVLCRELNLKPGETTADGKLTVSTVNCIGLCGVGPVATLDGKYLSELTPEKALELVRTL